MKSFTLENAHEYWSSYADTMIIRVLLLMESSEEWALDGDESIEIVLEQLFQTLKTASEIPDELALIKVLSVIRSTRVLYIMQMLDKNNPGIASKLLMVAEEHKEDNKYVQVFLKRNLVFERMRLLARVFSNARLDFVQKALEGNKA
jgi:intracellular multiplication protein IcmW